MKVLSSPVVTVGTLWSLTGV